MSVFAFVFVFVSFSMKSCSNVFRDRFKLMNYFLKIFCLILLLLYKLTRGAGVIVAGLILFSLFFFFYNWFIFFSNVFYFIWCPLMACEPTLVNFINRRQAAHLKRALTSWSPADIGPILSINSPINLIVMGVSNGKGTWREPLARWKEKVNSRKEEGKKKWGKNGDGNNS